MKILIAIIAALALAGCGKLEDIASTEISGYSVRCVEGTKYVLMSSDRGMAVAVLLGTDGKPKGCEK